MWCLTRPCLLILVIELSIIDESHHSDQMTQIHRIASGGNTVALTTMTMRSCLSMRNIWAHRTHDIYGLGPLVP
jgi:hypothetical protein